MQKICLKAFVIFFSLILSSFASARSWERIQIPGALCGDGSPYSVFLDKRNSEKILIELMGGGACWSDDSCNGAKRSAWTSSIPKVPAFSYMTAESAKHPWRNHTALYLPYCTGDVFAGKHVAEYKRGKKTWHLGYTNVIMTLNYLRNTGILHFENYTDATLWGASAGAIGALTHAHHVEAMFPSTTQLTLLVDSPGLHFGDSFFDKFPPKMSEDFRNAFGAIGLLYPEHSGFVAPYMGPVFERLNRWQIGIIQSTRDIVMSVGFGDISPIDYERRVVSSGGLEAVSRGYTNVKVWTSRSYMHTFLLVPYATDIENAERQSAINFAEEIYSQSAIR